MSEFHSGYRAYSVAALRQIDFRRATRTGSTSTPRSSCSSIEAGLRIVEIPIPTYYGDEICYVNGVRYARQVVRHSLDYRLEHAGFSTGVVPEDEQLEYDYKPSETSSHGRIIQWMSSRQASKVLDVGCAGGALADRLRAEGHYVVGIDASRSPDVESRVDEFVLADLDQGLPPEVTGEFDVIICADVLEHLRRPDRLLSDLRAQLGPSGSILTSVPNFAHWYPRLRTVTGRFDYDRRGILDATHLRFFTHRTFSRLAASSGFEVVRREPIGLPFDAIATADGEARPAGKRIVRLADQISVNVYPSMFAYQNLYELVAKNSRPAAFAPPSPRRTQPSEIGAHLTNGVSGSSTLSDPNATSVPECPSQNAGPDV